MIFFRWGIKLFLWALGTGALLTCTLPEAGKVHQRIAESLAGNLPAPADIDPPGTNNFTFAVFGDIHVGSPFGNILATAISHSKASGDNFVIVSGDLTDSALARDFDTFLRDFTDAGVEFRAAIGNHDLYFGGWDNYKSKIGPSVFSIDVDNVHISFLDSAEGVFGERQLNWLKSDLAQTSQEIKIIVSHFSVYTGELQSIWKLGSDEESAILKNIAFENDVALVIGAHYHGYLKRKIGNTIYVTSGGVNQMIDINESRHYLRVTIGGSNLSVEKIEF